VRIDMHQLTLRRTCVHEVDEMREHSKCAAPCHELWSTRTPTGQLLDRCLIGVCAVTDLSFNTCSPPNQHNITAEVYQLKPE
jgi:hypothetical protein